MRRLIEGYRTFRSEVYPERRELYDRLAEGQKPRYMILTCADSRVQPTELTQTGVGDFFSERSIGNLIPVPGRGETEAIASIEYAVTALGVEHVIICGHTNCGAIRALLNPESLSGMPNVAAWLAAGDETKRLVARKYPDLTGDDLIEAAVHENVVIQMGRARMIPAVARRLETGTVQVHGWVFQIHRGVVVTYDERAGAFVPLDETDESLLT